MVKESVAIIKLLDEESKIGSIDKKFSYDQFVLKVNFRVWLRVK